MRRGVGRNSILCEGYSKWVHKRCFNIRGSLSTVRNFKCKRCHGIVVGNPIEVKVNLGGNEIEVVKKFCYLGDVLSKEVGVRQAVTARIRAGCKKFRGVGSLFAREDCH